MLSPPVSTTDPCVIALVPHAGVDRTDQEIIRLQQAARRATEPAAYLERLGWAFVAKARLSFDPGFYKLAEQCALCIAANTPHSAEALLLRGHVLHHLHQFREGEALARQLVAQRGLSFDYGLLGDVLMEQGKLAEAVEAYQTMMDQKPSPQVYSRAAHVRWLTGDLAGAIELMHMAAGTGGFRNPEAAPPQLLQTGRPDALAPRNRCVSILPHLEPPVQTALCRATPCCAPLRQAAAECRGRRQCRERTAAAGGGHWVATESSAERAYGENPFCFTYPSLAGCVLGADYGWTPSKMCFKIPICSMRCGCG